MQPDWKIVSRIPDLFNPPSNPIVTFMDACDRAMSSNIVLLKGEADHPLTFADYRSPFTIIMRDAFLDLFLEFDRISGRARNYHTWEATPDGGSAPVARPETQELVKPNVYRKLKPMSYLGFIERLHWMLRTADSFYGDTHPDEETAQRLIHDFLISLFGKDTWNIGDPPAPWVGVPSWIEHPWTFYDVVPDFLLSTGYWEHNENLPPTAYFDGGRSDSCTFFFHERIFYILLTSGSP